MSKKSPNVNTSHESVKENVKRVHVPLRDVSLVVGDAHVDWHQATSKGGLRRFDALNKLIKDVKPNRVVVIGDFFTMDSLSEWDSDKRKKMEGRRLNNDVAAGVRALEMMYDGITDVPLIFTEGNHENRLDRYYDKNPVVDQTVDLGDTVAEAIGCNELTYVPYKSYWQHKGVSFTHVPHGENGKPIGGKSATTRALSIHDGSVVFGHTHLLATACEHRHGGRHLNQAVNVGCFFEHVDDYAKGSVTSYWRGVVLLDHYATNRVDLHTWALGKLLREYG